MSSAWYIVLYMLLFIVYGQYVISPASIVYPDTFNGNST